MNQSNSNIKLLKNKTVLSLTAWSKSTLYNRINDGLFCPPIPLGKHAVGFVEYEVQTILKAMVVGFDEEQIRNFVIQLVNKRQTFL